MQKIHANTIVCNHCYHIHILQVLFGEKRRGRITRPEHGLTTWVYLLLIKITKDLMRKFNEEFMHINELTRNKKAKAYCFVKYLS